MREKGKRKTNRGESILLDFHLLVPYLVKFQHRMIRGCSQVFESHVQHHLLHRAINKDSDLPVFPFYFLPLRSFIIS